MSKKSIVIILAVLIMATVLFAGCTTPQSAVTPTPTAAPTAAQTTAQPAMKNIVETAVADGRFTTLVAAVQAAKLDGTLSGPGPYTVFAPTDDAFKKLPPGTVEALLKTPEGTLKDILLYHVVDGKVMAADVVKLTSVKTLNGQNLSVKIVNNTVMVDGANVIITDIQTKNGVIHVIDSVMIPPAAAPTTAQPAMKNIVETAVADGRFTTLVAALQAAKLDGTLSGPGPYTVFAPTDDAFKKLPAGTVETLLKTPEGTLKDILLYHVVDGKVMAADVVNLTSAKTMNGKSVSIKVVNKTVMVDGANVTITDIQTKNGVIHVIDSVMIPPA